MRCRPYPSAMRIFTLEREQLLPGRPDQVFAFFADARNLEAITPPFLRFAVVTPGEIPMRVGTLIQYRLSLREIGVNWRSYTGTLRRSSTSGVMPWCRR